MSLRAELPDLDADIHAGLGETGQYVASNGATPVVCRIYLLDGVGELGTAGQVRVDVVEVAYMLADVQPATGGTVVVDGAAFRNVRRTGGDSSIERWAVARV